MTSRLFNNETNLTGKIVDNFTFSHNVLNEKFYKSEISVNRDSGYTDIIPIIISEKLIDTKLNYYNRCTKIYGEFRSYNDHNEEKVKLILYVFVKKFELLLNINKNINNIFLNGYFYKPPTFRITPFGKEISDVYLAVHRPYNKSDYIPCICWGRNAIFTKDLTTGIHVHAYGRIQSRYYVKKISEKENQIRIAYEISLNRLDYLKNNIKKQNF